jgi:very-short-patch-repair endonuclease
MDTLEKARKLRLAQTDAEAHLWRQLRAHRLHGLKFKRQKPMGHYIVDFVCIECRLIVELDGSQHADQQEYDSLRTGWLSAQGYEVIRFWNHEVMTSLHVVLETIYLKALQRNPDAAD